MTEIGNAGYAEASADGNMLGAAGTNGMVGALMALGGVGDLAIVMYAPDSPMMRTVLSYEVLPPKEGDRIIYVPFRGKKADSRFDTSETYDDLVNALRLADSNERYNLTALLCPADNYPAANDCRIALSEMRTRNRIVLVCPPLEDKPMYRGFDIMNSDLVDLFSESKRAVRKNTVNVLGVSVTQKDWSVVSEEFGTMLALMGLDVVCNLGTEATLNSIADSVHAEYNIVLCPEYAESTANTYSKNFGTEAITTGYAPVGFDATEELLNLIARRTGHPANLAIAHVHRLKRRALRGQDLAGSDLAGRTFAVDADPSIAYPLVRWLSKGLRLTPVSVKTAGDGMSEAEAGLKIFLEKNGWGGALNADIPKDTDYFFGTGTNAAVAECTGVCREGIPIGFPPVTRRADLINSPVLGPSGALYVLDRMINRRAGGP